MEPIHPPDFSPATLPEESPLTGGAVLTLRVALGAIPVLGGAVSEGLGALVAWNAARQTTEWLKVLESRFIYLDERLSNLESTEKAQEVLAMTITAAHAAAKSHQEEKRKLLQNAVLNTALQGTDGADERLVFIRFLDELTPTHLRVLRSIQQYGTSLIGLRRHAVIYRALQDRGLDLKDEDLFRLCFIDLQNRNLIAVSPEVGDADPYTSNSPISTWRSAEMTVLGVRFLEFIHDPELG